MTSVDQISIAGFSDPTTVAELRLTRCANVPSHTGIYLIESDAEGAPKFRIPSTGGWFNGLDPDYPPDIIQANWVVGAHIVYVGKAAGLVGLRRRLRQFIDFGCGKPVPHRGGRLLWHLQDSDELLVRRMRLSAPRRSAITDFKRSHRGLRPFANMNK